MPEQSPANRPAVVISGGSSGVGYALCRLAAKQGWHVWIGYGQGVAKAERLAAELNDAGGSAAAIHLSLQDSDSLRTSIAMIADRKPVVDALVLCAAPPPGVAPFLKQTTANFRNQFECAVVGNHLLIGEVWRQCMRRRGGGHVLAVSSAALGPPAAPHMASYICSKAALVALLQSAAAEFGRAGLRVSTISPGYIDTPMLRAFQPLLLDRARAIAPGQRFLHAEDVAQVLMRGLQNPPPPGAVVELTLPATSGGVAARTSVS